MARRRYFNAAEGTELPAIVKLWIVRLLISLGGHKRLVESNGLNDDDLGRAAGLSDLIDGPAKYSAIQARARMRAHAKKVERQHGNSVAPSPLRENVERLRQHIGLSSADARILEFVALMHTTPLLAEAFGNVGNLLLPRLFQVVSVLLSLQYAEVVQSIGPAGALTRSGLISLGRRSIFSGAESLSPISEKFAERICTLSSDPMDLLKHLVVQGGPSPLDIGDFQHVSATLAILVPYLRAAASERRTGVNVLVYGLPGTGKSELAKVLAQTVNLTAYEVVSEDDNGEALRRTRRLRAFGAAQSFLSKSNALLVFDEAEDVFRVAKRRKAWVNRALETNPVPTVWISNTVQPLDNAFIRRFDIVMEMPIPLRRQRQQLIRAACNDLASPAAVERLADTTDLTPAVVTRAAKVVRTIQDDFPKGDKSSAVELLIDSTLRAQGHDPLDKKGFSELASIYDVAFIRADAEPAHVARQLHATGAGRLCLFGPPGTGKTAYGQWLARELDMPLAVQRASDLLSKWVGESEQNIARAFRDAEQERAVLLIDEVDSFLQDRRGPRQSWEITLVNEILTQIESYSGVLIASTNLMSGIDQAALRRFDLKVRFDYLSIEQAWPLLLRYCQKLNLPTPTGQEWDRLSRLAILTPGDFANVARQSRLRTLERPSDFVSALETECSLKEGPARRIGFT